MVKIIKNLILLFVLFNLILSPIVYAEEGIQDPAWIKNNLNAWDNFLISIGLMSTSGESRSCSVYAIPNTGYVCGIGNNACTIIQGLGISYNVNCALFPHNLPQGTAVVDFYKIKCYGTPYEYWQPLTEKDSPGTYNGGIGSSTCGSQTLLNKMGYECYGNCDPISLCNSGQRICAPGITPTQYRECVNGQYSNPINCPSGQTCLSNGYCGGCVPLWNTGNWGQCQSNNQQTRNVWDSHSCGTTQGKPSTTQNCNYVQPTPSPTPSPTPIIPTNNADFKVEILSWTPQIPESEGQINVQVKIINEGNSGTMKIETGFYTDEQIANWYDNSLQSIISSTSNCEPIEINVQTKEITLNAGEEITTTFTFNIPKICSITGTNTENYKLHSTAYINCYNTGIATGQTSYDIKEITANPDFSLLNCFNCNDGLLNGMETDTDCGGLSCEPCGILYQCLQKSDCEGDLVCSNNVCMEEEQSEEGEHCQYPLTSSEWKQATDMQIVNSMCKTVQDCCDRADYEIGCIHSEEIGDLNWEAWSSETGAGKTYDFWCNSFKSLPQIASSILGWTTGACSAGLALTETPADGTCRATQPCNEFISSLDFGLSDNPCTSGTFTIVLGILLILILFMFKGS